MELFTLKMEDGLIKGAKKEEGAAAILVKKESGVFLGYCFKGNNLQRYCNYINNPSDSHVTWSRIHSELKKHSSEYKIIVLVAYGDKNDAKEFVLSKLAEANIGTEDALWKNKK